MSYRTDSEHRLKVKHNGQKSPKYSKDLERLASGEPLDYLIGNSDFLHCKISLKNKPLIPRVETEYWVDKVLKTIPIESSPNILDLFSGSGCIGVALLKHLPHVEVTFAEKRSDLLETINESISFNGLNKKTHSVVQSDVFSNVSGIFDYIFSNPPYIDKERKETEESVLKNEPHDALFANDNGLEYVNQLIIESPRFLKSGGILFIEFDSWQKDSILTFIESDSKKYSNVEIIEDQYTVPRVLKLTVSK